MAKVIIESAVRGRFLVTAEEWQRGYLSSITGQVNSLAASLNRLNVRPPQPPVSATSPLVNNPAGVSINLGKHNLRQEDLHIPESKRRRSTATAPGMSASPSSTADPASVPPITQTPQTMGTPNTHPMSTPSALQAANKRPSTGSPSAGSLPPSKMQIGPGGLPSRDRAVDEAIAKRLAKERAEELEREEARKDPLEYVKNAMYKAVGTKKSDQSGAAKQTAPMVVGLADQVRLSGLSTNGTVSPNGAATKPLSGQKAQLPSPPWSGTITPRQLAETFANTTDIEFALKSMMPVKLEAEDLNGFSMMDMLVNGGDEEAEENHVKEELSDLDFLSPLDGESGWDDAYSWTKNLQIPWNGDIGNVLEQVNNLGVVV